ncbi:hypothetical protein EVAR_42849_1 [Eumeta japonica]|uniref:Uncharacterized protein n=1 Tax=Eumeta variegata TaxID=151549 RepID=A0A4C1WFN1_EUMVA|nr:hypothetical protein EVAR_42849_1 [Eumeta japonica]
MSCAGRAGRYQERQRAVAERPADVADFASDSTAAVPVAIYAGNGMAASCCLINSGQFYGIRLDGSARYSLRELVPG